MKNSLKERNKKIYKAWKSGETVKYIAKKYNLTISSIYKICKGLSDLENPNCIKAKEYNLYQLCEKHFGSQNYLQLSRMYNALIRYGIHSVNDLRDFPIDNVNHIHGIGHKFASVLKKMIAEVNASEMPILKMELCEDRHKTLAEDGSVFSHHVTDITDIEKLELSAQNRIWEVCYEKYKAGKDGYIYIKEKESSKELLIDPRLHIDLYVTGLSVALISVINVCLRENIGLTLWHYDIDTKEYYPQKLSR